tara:strand:+ start:608 stop:889 length:282 start_codon:yes stop_codon:yes gene_type:complete
VILVKVYEKEDENDSLFASVTVPSLSEEFTIDEEDREAIFPTMANYDPDKYMIVISYSSMSDRGSNWMRFSSYFDVLHFKSGTISLDHIIGEA